MKEEKKRTAIKLPEGISFNQYDYDCTHCYYCLEGKGDQIYCDYYKDYYYPIEAYNCTKFYLKY